MSLPITYTIVYSVQKGVMQTVPVWWSKFKCRNLHQRFVSAKSTNLQIDRVVSLYTLVGGTARLTIYGRSSQSRHKMQLQMPFHFPHQWANACVWTIKLFEGLWKRCRSPKGAADDLLNTYCRRYIAHWVTVYIFYWLICMHFIRQNIISCGNTLALEA